MFRLLFAALAAMCFVTPAQAVTITYSYQGLPLTHASGTPWFGPTRPGFSGIMTISEEVLGQSLANATISFTRTNGPHDPNNPENPWLLDFTVFYTGVVRTTLTFTTDAARNIIAWGGVLYDDPEYDTISSVDGDMASLGYLGGKYYSDGPGSWRIAAVVPLPAALPMLGSVLGGLGLTVWLRRRANDMSPTSTA